MNIYTLPEVAKMLKMNPEVTRRHARAGRLPGSKPGKEWRFVDSDIQKFLEGGRIKGGLHDE